MTLYLATRGSPSLYRFREALEKSEQRSRMSTRTALLALISQTGRTRAKREWQLERLGNGRYLKGYEKPVLSTHHRGNLPPGLSDRFGGLISQKPILQPSLW